ncbi:MAG: CD1845 family protein [Clostridiales Family XIII bacterium]|jgi:hypothetical protein|nr:CD1845 family protein [Clostridiales Family XIII bacterium]
MRLISKPVAAPVAPAPTILTAVFSFVLSVSDVFFGIASGLVSVGAVVLLITGETVGGLAWIGVAFLVSPYGLPGPARRLIGRLEGLSGSLKGFIFG